MTDRPATQQRVVVLGGGMAGLVTAWQLTQPDARGCISSVTVVQRGHRLGGKGASSRGPNDRIEEHGLHVLLGYYDNTFRVIRECYAELDRERTRPDCPIKSWTDAFRRSSSVGVADRTGGTWETWLADFAENDRTPGDPDATDTDPAALWSRALQLLVDFFASVARERPSLYFSSSPHPSPLLAAIPGYEAAMRSVQLGATAILARALAAQPPVDDAFLLGQIERLRTIVAKQFADDPALARTHVLVDLILTCVLGMTAEGVLGDLDSLARLDHVDFRSWLSRHGAAASTLESGIVRGLYDLVFAYDDGDPARPGFPAGLGLFLAGKIFFDYKGAIFWKMTAGMGDVVFAPLYEALRRRGVEFRFFHRVDALRLDDSGTAVDAIELTEQTPLARGRVRYEPLTDHGGMPCFPARADRAQLARPADADLDFEMHGVRGPAERVLRLRRGEHFDAVVLATSIGAVPLIAADLVERLPRWRDMVDGVPTVATQAFQLWMSGSEDELRCVRPGATVSGYVEPFDTWASMSHLLAFEDWSGHPQPVGTLAYFCSPLPDGSADHRAAAAAEAHREDVERSAVRFLEQHLRLLLPGAYGPGGFDRDRVVDTYVRANVDPSDRYVRSRPGTTSARLRADGSGITNLSLAGDWTDCGLNAGCMEAAALSGVQAANAVLGRSRATGILGRWLGLGADR